ncbi:hypothetical protein DY000_02002308 [Brassica cretica]|uniref:Uncharacterized protein n=1 Tax=Brassica cretica TaxID=69181 RepID=A0ABQ7BU07_BRACR|nr:hypothetical protein DY000_02002308 [Brassica cretica]
MHSRNQDGAIYGVLHTIPKLTMEIKFGTVDASKHMNPLKSAKIYWSKRARHQKPTTSSPPHFAATPRLKTSDLYRGDDEQQSRQQRSKEDGGGKR